jgi:ubiquinone/menaquinone biosynthesis C-methylase UbiE
VEWGAGLHAAQGRPVDEFAYGQYIGRWSRLFVPALLTAAEVTESDRVLDVATGPGEAAVIAASTVGDSGFVVGADISSAMLDVASVRLSRSSFGPVTADGQALPFPADTFGAVVCQLGLMFFPNPTHGLTEFRRVLHPGRCAAVCVISSPDRAPMWGALAESLSRHLPEQAHALHLSFALSDPERLEQIFRAAGFCDVRIQRETREGTFSSFDEYWAPIEAGTGLMPLAYLSLPEASRQAVRTEVCAHLARYESNGRLVMSVEMLIAAGRA